MFTEARPGSTVGVNQLSNVSWSVVFDDVELTAADIARLARQARPMVESHGRWVAIDRLDLERAAAALAERESVTELTGAEILRQSIGLDGSAARRRGRRARRQLGQAASSTARTTRRSRSTSPPSGFTGTLRSYQAEALAWIDFLDANELGGCLALDMGLGKTPTVLAHLARTAGDGTSLVIAPAAVVGNWAAEAARFAPELRVVVHHGAARATRLAAGEGDRRRRRRHHHLRHRGARRRRPGRRGRGRRWCSTRRRRSRTRRAKPRRRCAGSPPAHGWR